MFTCIMFTNIKLEDIYKNADVANYDFSTLDQVLFENENEHLASFLFSSRSATMSK